MELSRATGWWPWIPYDARDIAQSPYGYRQVEIARPDFQTPQVVAPRSLHPTINVVDLWWRPLPADADPSAWVMPDARHGIVVAPRALPTLATLQARLDALCAFVGSDPRCHAPLDEIVTLEDHLRTISTAVELMQGQIAEILALLKGARHA
jgi:hypothetical protein